MKSTKKYKQLIFDVDETLFDFRKSEEEAFKRTLSDFSLEYSVALLDSYRSISKVLWKMLEDGKIHQEALKYKRFEDLFLAHEIKADHNQFGVRYIDHLAMQNHLFPGVFEIVEKLSLKAEIILLTNGITKIQKSRIKRSEINGFISGVVISEEVGISKPSVGIFEHMHSLYGKYPKADMLMIGDSLSSDIQGGINFGIDTCWYNPKGLKQEDVIPTYEIDTLENLLEFV